MTQQHIIFLVLAAQFAFSANRAGRFDIYTVDLETREVRNVTDDETFDGSPQASASPARTPSATK